MVKTTRLIDEGSGAMELERALIASAPDVTPPPSAQAEVWAALSRLLPPSGTGGEPSGGMGSSGSLAPAASTLAKRSLTSGAVKLIAAAALAGGFVAAVVMTRSARTGSAQDVPPSATRGPAALTTPSRALEGPNNEVSPAPRVIDVHSLPALPAASVPAFRAPAAPPPSDIPSALGTATAPSALSELREESAALQQARATLEAGDAPGTLALLDAIRRRFPRGALHQERDALMIEALWLNGDRASATSRADAFLRAFPESPHAARVRRFSTP